MRRLLMAGAMVCGSLAATGAHAAYPECPTGADAAGLMAWRQAAIAAMSSGQRAVLEIVKNCFPATAPVPACMERFKSYATRGDTSSSSNDIPFASAPEKQPPPEMAAPGGAPNEFIVPANIEEIAAQKGWPIVRYKSRHAGGFDNSTASLMMMLVPGDTLTPPVDYDRWLNFALPADPGEGPVAWNTDAFTQPIPPVPSARVPSIEDFAANDTYPRTFTMVSQTRRQGNQPAKVWFQMFGRSGRGSPVYTASGNIDTRSCVSCHPNGLRHISPVGYHVRLGETAMPDAQWNMVTTINEAMDAGNGQKVVSWREVDGKPLLNPAAYWPIYSANRPLNDKSRTEAFIMGTAGENGQRTGGCFNSRTEISVRDIFRRAPGFNNVYKLSETPSIRWNKVRDAMKCEACHNNRMRGAINELTDSSQVDFKLVADQSMPQGAHANPLELGEAQPTDELTGDERIALANCLQAEFQLERPLVSKWLAEKQCQ